MKKILIIVSILTAILSHDVLAQDKFFYFNLDINKSFSNTEWIDKVSARGAKLGYRVFINPRISAGIDVSWTTFDEYLPPTTIQSANGAITTDYFRYLYSYSIAASAQYYFAKGDSERFFPYAGLGLGAMNNEYVLYYNIYQDSEQTWGFLARPEAGILVRFGERRSLGAMAAIHYDYASNKSDKFNYKNLSALGFQIGIMLMDW